MYSTFSVQLGAEPKKQQGTRRDGRVSADAPRVRRRPVPNACQNCRKNRIKCDSLKPCRNCRAKDLDCDQGDTVDVQGLLKQVHDLVGKVGDLESELQGFRAMASEPVSGSPRPRERADSGSPFVAPSGASASPTLDSPLRDADPVPDGSSLDLSTDSFMREVGAVLTRESIPHRLRARPALNQSPASGGDAHAPDSIRLPRNIQDYYLRHYWKKIHPHLPVVDEEAFRAHYSSLWSRSPTPGTRLGSSMVDIVLALSIQHEISSKPHGPDAYLPGMPTDQKVRDGQQLTANALYHSCYSELNVNQETPSWNTLQCYILVVVYLRHEWRHNSAYQVLGCAIRAANVLGLHRPPPEGTPREEVALRDQIRDFLFCFDTQQFLEFARPCGLLDLSPTRHVIQGSDGRCFWSYWSGLMAIAKDIHCSLIAKAGRLRSTARAASPPHAPITRLLEEEIPRALALLSTWVSEVPERYRIQRRWPPDDVAPFSTDVGVIEVDVKMPDWQIRQCLMLELSYHWVVMCLLRWFIGPGGPVDRDDHDDHDGNVHPYAARAVKHAAAIIVISRRALDSVDIVHGWYDAHLMQWDAALSLIYFIPHYPSSRAAHDAHSLLLQCGAMFSDVGTAFTNGAAQTIEDIGRGLAPCILPTADASGESDGPSSSSSSNPPGPASEPPAVVAMCGHDQAAADALGAFEACMDLDAFLDCESLIMDEI